MKRCHFLLLVFFFTNQILTAFPRGNSDSRCSVFSVGASSSRNEDDKQELIFSDDYRLRLGILGAMGGMYIALILFVSFFSKGQKESRDIRGFDYQDPHPGRATTPYRNNSLMNTEPFRAYNSEIDFYQPLPSVSDTTDTMYTDEPDDDDMDDEPQPLFNLDHKRLSVDEIRQNTLNSFRVITSEQFFKNLGVQKVSSLRLLIKDVKGKHARRRFERILQLLRDHDEGALSEAAFQTLKPEDQLNFICIFQKLEDSAQMRQLYTSPAWGCASKMTVAKLRDTVGVEQWSLFEPILKKIGVEHDIYPLKFLNQSIVEKTLKKLSVLDKNHKKPSR